jgi:hypothetical protein
MTPARQSDEQLLDLLAMRSGGMTPQRIADATGLRVQYVSTATNRVMRADMAESGEDVIRHYWRIKRSGGAA